MWGHPAGFFYAVGIETGDGRREDRRQEKGRVEVMRSTIIYSRGKYKHLIFKVG
jgi:hypothetical protein